MAAIIDRQHIAKRRKKNFFSFINKSAGLNAGFMSQFSQKPARVVRKKTPVFRLSLCMSFFEALKKYCKPIPKHKIPHLETNAKARVKQKVEGFKLRSTNKKPAEKPLKEAAQEKKASGFTISLPSFGTLAVSAGVIVLALIVFNWENINNKMPEKYIYQPVSDSEIERRTMLYAATGITSIFSAQNTGVFSDTPAEAVSDNGEFSAPQNELINFEWHQYKVQRGDAVSVIAKKYDISVGAIIAANEIRNARALREGQILRIPNIDGIPYQIKKGDSLLKIAVSFDVPLEVILDVNDIRSDDITAGETLFIPGARMNDIDLAMSLGEVFIYPVPSRIRTSEYGMRKDPISGALTFHTGIDLRASTGTAVVAALDGTVSVVSENRVYGKYIILTHANGYKTLYGHLSSQSVKQGERVARSRKIGEAGSTGYSTGPHLHFTVYDRNNKLVNPLDLLK